MSLRRSNNLGESLEIIEYFLDEHGYRARSHHNAKLPQERTIRFIVETSHGNMTFIESERCPACVEIWVGGNHEGRSRIKYKYHSVIAFMIDLHKPNSLQRVLEILENPVEKEGDWVLKHR
jgi:hypothetical protein